MRKRHLDKIEQLMMDFVFYVALPVVALIHIAALYYPPLGQMLLGN